MEVRIDTLRLQVAGMSPDTAGQFGRLVAERLGAALAAAPPEASPARFDGLHVTVPAPPEASPGTLAATTATEISRALRRGVTR
jgi:hypothetical protein